MSIVGPQTTFDIYFPRECVTAMKNLRRNPEIHICQPDKGSGMVTLNMVDYVNKMLVILQDQSKFRQLERVDTHNRTSRL